MKTKLSLYLILVYSITFQVSCGKKNDNLCESITKPSGEFVIKELIGDTAFIADTVFRDNYVQFQTTESYEGVKWKVGSDPRVWTTPEFTLNFHTTLGTLPVAPLGRINQTKYVSQMTTASTQAPKI